MSEALKLIPDQVLLDEIYRRAKMRNEEMIVGFNLKTQIQEIINSGRAHFTLYSDGHVLLANMPIRSLPPSQAQLIQYQDLILDSQVFKQSLANLSLDLGIENFRFSLAYRDGGPQNEITVLIYTNDAHYPSINLPRYDLRHLINGSQIDQTSMIKILFKVVSLDIQFEHFPDPGPRPLIDVSESRRLRPIVQEAQIEYCDHHSNIAAVFGDYAYLKGQWSTEPHIVVFVHTKSYIPLGENPLPKIYKGVPVSVYEGRYQTLPGKDVIEQFDDPSGEIGYSEVVGPGTSIGARGSDAIGTLGGFLTDQKTSESEKIYFLTNHHVVIETSNESSKVEVLQPAVGDYRRFQRRQLRYQNLNKKRLQEELNELYRPLNTQEIDQCRIGTVTVTSSTTYIGNLLVEARDGARSIPIGVDAAIGVYESTRLVTTEVESRLPDVTITSEMVPWDAELEEKTDQVLKTGRTTGYTIGFPLSLSGAVINMNPGNFSLERGDLLMTVNQTRIKIEKHSQKRIVLSNQHLVGHKAGGQFASPGDSGAICYLNSKNWPAEDRWKLRPWGLLNGHIINNIYRYGILSPIDAVMKAIGYNRILISSASEHLLGRLRYDL